MRIGIRAKILGGFAIILLLFIVTTIYSLQSISSLEQHVQMTHDHTLTVTLAVIKIEVGIMAIHRSMKDVAISSSGEERSKYISAVQNNEDDALAQFDIVLKQILGDEGQKLALNARKVFIDWRPIREEVIALLEDGRFNEAQSITRTEGDEYVDIIMDDLKKLEEYAEVKAMELNDDSADVAIRTCIITMGALVLFTVIGLFTALYLSVSITRRIKYINQAVTKMSQGEMSISINNKGEDEISQLGDSFNKMAWKLKEMYESLELKVLDRTEDLNKANKELLTLKQSLEKTIIERTKDLEKKVLELDRSEKAMLYMVEDLNQTSELLKTEQENLVVANKELEAFSYSVSHDLRAPLRAIDGFTRILMEDYVANMDTEGKRLGTVIQNNARKMGMLIDDLLVFSRSARSTMRLSQIDMKNMVNSIYHEATKPEDRQRINLNIGDLPEAEGDTNMMRQVWMNLFSNAIKFSSHRKQALISVSCQEKENKLIYCIKDNGAGFNMKYKDKLFGVFKRLHNDKEFEGTGVGLALIQRIIQRHGGEVWANSKVDNGAEFYFSLPTHRKT